MSVTESHLMSTYARRPITFASGEGVWLKSDQQERYLDALSGIAVCSLGHAHPEFTQAIVDQAATLIHTSNIYQIELQEKLARKLCGLAGMDSAFFCNSGAEANETAIKLARVYGHQKGLKEPAIISMKGGFHGRTLAALTATGNQRAHAGFEPLVPGFIQAAYDDVGAVETLLNHNSNVAAVLVEPIQGEGGIHIPEKNYLLNLKALCEQHEVLLMLDEVQTGIGRTGRWFCFQHTSIQPDVLITAKGLGNGIPIGACLAKKYLGDLFSPGMHGSTFGGNPFACRAALATLDIIEKNNLIHHADKIGDWLIHLLQSTFSTCSNVKEIRGRGLMIGMEMTIPCTELVDLCLKKNVLINVTADRVVRLLPPLIFDQANAELLVRTLAECIDQFDTM